MFSKLKTKKLQQIIKINKNLKHRLLDLSFKNERCRCKIKC